MTVVANSSPLISLAASGLLDVLPALFGTVHIPDAVYDEVVTKGQGRAGAQLVTQAAWITRHTVADRQKVEAFCDQTKLHRGEAEAILLAVELGATAIILDDAGARKAALAHQLTVTGTVGVLLSAKKQIGRAHV